MFGAIGSGAAIVVIVLLLIAYKRGNGGKLKVITDHTVLYWSAALGLLCASAGEALRQVSAVSELFGKTLTEQSATIGPVGAGGIAVVLIVIGFAFKPHLAKDLIVGVALPGALSTSGGLLSIPVVLLGALIHGLGA